MQALPNRPTAVSLIAISFLGSLGHSSFDAPVRPQLLAIEAPVRCESTVAAQHELILGMATEFERKRGTKTEYHFVGCEHSRIDQLLFL